MKKSVILFWLLNDYSRYMDSSCEELDRDFCAGEIISAINTLKTYYILQTGYITETWLVGRIMANGQVKIFLI